MAWTTVDRSDQLPSYLDYFQITNILQFLKRTIFLPPSPFWPLAYLAKFTEFGEIGDREEVDVDHAEKFKVFEVRGQPTNLSIV